MRFADQSTVLEWLPVEMKPVRQYEPKEITRQKMNFESVVAAVIYATTVLPEGFRVNATIKTEESVTLYWADIERMSKG
jgi:hypothetical protein